MNNAINTVTIESAAALGSASKSMPQSFVVAACASDIDTLELFKAFDDAKQAAQFEAGTAELAATGEFEDFPSVIAYRARQAK